MLNPAVDMGIIEKNNIREMQLSNLIVNPTRSQTTKHKQIIHQVYSQKELKFIVTELATDETVPHWFYNFVVIMANTGLRDQEMAALDINNSVNLKEQYLQIDKAITGVKGQRKRLGPTKNGVHRRVYFNNIVKETIIDQIKVIKRLMAKHADYGWQETPNSEKLYFLFAHGNGLPFAVPYLGRRWTTAIADHPDIPKYSLYSLRHTYATLMYKKTQDAPTVAKSLGHTVATFLRYYVDALDEDQKQLSNIDLIILDDD
ncbi:tyrosine-type recombinase/integrase [Lactiplantibacillus modestisalitolerans]|nr:tyrosine-type recombinase/integrase [Lactiplantibacillus modestisalitolerans]